MMEFRKAAAMSHCADLVAEIEDPYRLCLATIDHLYRSLDYQRAAVILRRTDDEGLVVFAHCHGGRAEAEHRVEIARVNAVLDGLTTGILMSVVQERQPRVVNDVANEADFVRIHPAVRATACFPLLTRGRCLGAFTVDSFQPDAFDDDDYLLLKCLACQLALHLDRSRPQDLYGFLRS